MKRTEDDRRRRFDALFAHPRRPVLGRQVRARVYRGTVPAGAIARETGLKEGQHIRVLPFGYVAHDEAENPRALLDTAVTVDAGGAVREIAVTWGTWRYTVTYSDLGATEAPVAPANARDLLKERLQRP
jgi:hypothetical protein